MITVDENTVVELGKYYMVRCAVVAHDNGKTEWIVPIIGIEHKDPQFGPVAASSHYHIDGRFAKEGTGEFCVDKNGKTNGVVLMQPHYHFDVSVKEVITRRLKCKRLTTGIKPPISKKWPVVNDSSWTAWYKPQIGKSCAGKKCPHLGTMMQVVGGRLVCPLHNLQGCTETEKIIEAIEFSNQ